MHILLSAYVVAAVNIFIRILLLLIRFCFDRAFIILIVNDLAEYTYKIDPQRTFGQQGSFMFVSVQKCTLVVQ